MLFKHHVVRLGFNLGHRAPWLSGLVAEHGYNTHFVVTDPDVVPTGDCPSDLFEKFAVTLDQHPEIDKIGLSLKIDCSICSSVALASRGAFSYSAKSLIS